MWSAIRNLRSNMRTKRQRIQSFVIQCLLKIFAFVLIMSVVGFALNYPTLANAFALSQFENNDSLYAGWEGFLRLRNFFNSYYDIITAIFGGSIIYDIIDFIKINKEKTKHEN